MRNVLKRALVVLAAVWMVGCGGGGGSAGTSQFGPGSGSTSGGSSGSGSSSGTTDGAASNSSGTLLLSMTSNVVSSSSPGRVTAMVKDSAGAAIVGTLVKFAVTDSSIATVSPTSALTDAAGQASTIISPASQTAVGATYVTSTTTTTSGDISTQFAFSVSPVNVTLDSLAVGNSPLSAYGSTSLDFTISGASSASPVTVNLSSSCVTAGKAVISPASLSVTTGGGSVTYTDKGCNGTDRIAASIAATNQQQTTDLVVQAPAAQAMEFVSATPAVVCLAGSGCPSSSAVSFKLTDQFGNGVANQQIDFALDVPGVAALSFPDAKTDASGLVIVSVLSKTIPTPIRVRATVHGSTLSTVSNTLSINAGLPTQNAFSFSAQTFNVDGLERDGVVSQIRVQLNDRFGNPVPNGTAVSFVTEGSAIIPAVCTTLDAVCTVNFVTSNYRPPNGRVSVVAFAQGEESFSDLNGDNLYTLGESFDDLGEVFVDKNENRLMDAGEYLAGTPKNGVWDSNTYVRYNSVFVLSSSATAPRLFQAIDRNTCSNTPLGSSVLNLSLVSSAACTAQQLVCIRDGNANADSSGGNPVPSGATLSVATSVKGVTVTIDGSPVTSLATQPTVHAITAKRADCAVAPGTGTVDVSVQMPNSGPLYTTLGVAAIN